MIDAMKILTLNTWNEEGPWKKRWEIIFAEVNRLKPDLIGFQEVFDKPWAGEIVKRLGFNYSVFSEDPSGLLILSRFPLKKWISVKLKTQSPNEDYSRYALLALCQAKRKTLAFLNTHLSWRLNESAIREKQVDDILELLDAQAPGIETVAVGDFNAPPDSVEIKKMCSSGGFNDVYALCHPHDFGLTWDNRNHFTATHGLPDRRLDYVFVRNEANVLNTIQSIDIIFNKPNREGIFASDHFGLLACFGD